ncbi:hypothetical protein Tco_1431365 [Tanacetum coccineum]
MVDLQPEREEVQGVEEKAFIKENIDVLRTMIKEYDQQTKTKATPKKLTYEWKELGAKLVPGEEPKELVPQQNIVPFKNVQNVGK